MQRKKVRFLAFSLYLCFTSKYSLLGITSHHHITSHRLYGIIRDHIMSKLLILPEPVEVWISLMAHWQRHWPQPAIAFPREIIFLCNDRRLTEHATHNLNSTYFPLDISCCSCPTHGSLNVFIHIKFFRMLLHFFNRLWSSAFTGPTYLRSNWAVCGPRNKMSLTPLCLMQSFPKYLLAKPDQMWVSDECRLQFTCKAFDLPYM